MRGSAYALSEGLLSGSRYNVHNTAVTSLSLCTVVFSITLTVMASSFMVDARRMRNFHMNTALLDFPF